MIRAPGGMTSSFIWLGSLPQSSHRKRVRETQAKWPRARSNQSLQQTGAADGPSPNNMTRISMARPGAFLMQDDVVALFAYDCWANRKVLDACRKLTAEQYVAEPVPGWSSVRSTLSHIALATEFNLRTLVSDPDDRMPTEAELATVDNAAQLLERV